MTSAEKDEAPGLAAKRSDQTHVDMPSGLARPSPARAFE